MSTTERVAKKSSRVIDDTYFYEKQLAPCMAADMMMAAAARRPSNFGESRNMDYHYGGAAAGRLLLQLFFVT